MRAPEQMTDAQVEGMIREHEAWAAAFESQDYPSDARASRESADRWRKVLADRKAAQA